MPGMNGQIQLRLTGAQGLEDHVFKWPFSKAKAIPLGSQTALVVVDFVPSITFSQASSSVAGSRFRLRS